MGGRGRIRDGDSQSARASTRTRQPELGEIYSSRRHAACAERGIAIQSSRAKPRDPEEVTLKISQRDPSAALGMTKNAYFWHLGHQAVVRPPIVARRNGVLCRGHFPPASQR